jgi:hypothetical protein
VVAVVASVVAVVVEKERGRVEWKERENRELESKERSEEEEEEEQEGMDDEEENEEKEEKEKEKNRERASNSCLAFMVDEPLFRCSERAGKDAIPQNFWPSSFFFVPSRFLARSLIWIAP